jgi:hypothetical protein
VPGRGSAPPVPGGGREHLKDVSVEGIISGLDSLLPEVDKAVLTEEFGQDMAASTSWCQAWWGSR